MKSVEQIADLRAQVRQWRGQGLVVGFVPTMGNLHEGHFALVRQAKAAADRVVASIFVNPSQFGPNEDYLSYPRTPEADAQGLEAAGCDLLFAPGVAEMYPEGLPMAVEIDVPSLSGVLCGAVRPGHFKGVATVVCKLFNLVQPDLAVFGRKDLQQLIVIRQLVRHLDIPVRILAGETVREPNGLARSSRNRYLSPEQREAASEIYQCLSTMAGQLRSGIPVTQVESDALATLGSRGLVPDYASVRRQHDLGEPDGVAPRVVLIAARFGPARLIDNLDVDQPLPESV